LSAATLFVTTFFAIFLSALKTTASEDSKEGRRKLYVLGESNATSLALSKMEVHLLCLIIG
jgi:hypothetical protein